MMNDKDILKHIDKGIDRRFRAPNVIVKPEAITAMAKKAAYEVMEPYIYYVQTTNATATTLATIELENYSGGWMEVVVLGIESDGSTMYTVKYYVRYHRTTTLTMVYESDWTEDDFPGLIVLVQDNGSENIEIEVTGLAATTIDWECHIITHRKILATAAP
jgi:hypothetical protein